MTAAALLLSVLLAAAAPEPAGDPGEALREAARTGDLAQIEALLAAGAPVDAPARYGQTPLYIAAERGRLEAVRRLVAAGADVDVRDRFFGASALAVALWSDHVEVALHLLAHGADDAAPALDAAVEKGDLELARAALATGLIEPLDLAAARRAAAASEAEGAAALQELLAAATATRRERPPYQAPPERLADLAGTYRARDGGEVAVAVRGGGLVVTLPEHGEIAVAPVAEDRFDTADGGGCRWSSAGAPGWSSGGRSTAAASCCP